MTFFNKKTEVMNFELTPHGRHLLSLGKLNPKYYDFTDDDVLYDVSYGFTSEQPEAAHNRIINETPKLKNIIIKTGVESNYLIRESTAQRQERNTNTNLTYDQDYMYSLGKSSLDAEYYPELHVSMLKGKITGSHHILTSSAVTNLPIPQINVDFTVRVKHAFLDEKSPNDYVHTIIHEDGERFTYLEFEEPIIHLKEFSTPYEKDNFEIEVFHMEPYEEKSTVLNTGTIDKLVPLSFLKPNDFIINDIYIENSQAAVNIEGSLHSGDITEELPTDEKLTQYYFEIEVDEDIPFDELCDAVGKLDINNQFLDKDLICPDQRTERFDLYETRVQPGDLEDCD